MKISFDCVDDIEYTISNAILKYNAISIKTISRNKKHNFIIDNDNIFLKFRGISFCICDINANTIAVFYYEDIAEINFYFV